MAFTLSGIQAFLFLLFGGLTAILAAVIGPTYDGLLVPELAPGALYPSLAPHAAGSFLTGAVTFSDYLLVNLVDPLVGLVGLGVGLAYLGRAFLGRWASQVEPLFAKLVLSVLLANFTVPLAGSILAIAGAAYPVIAGFDGGTWQHWVNLAGYGQVAFSWDNGILAFVVSFALFSLVMVLAAAVALRDALLSVILVLLPVLTLLWSIPPLAPLARRAWLLFGELAFLPCVMVIPLELAVGSPSILLLLGYLTVAAASPSLISLTGAQLTSAGFPSAGGVVAGGLQRGLAVGAQSVQGVVRPLSGSAALGRASTAAVGSASRALGASAIPGGLPLVAAEFLGRGAAHLFTHVASRGIGAGRDRFPAVKPPGGKVG